MGPAVEGKPGAREGLLRTAGFLLENGVSPFSLLFPAALAMAAASLEGVSIGLLLPLANGILTSDLSTIRALAPFRWLLPLLFPYGAPNTAVFSILIGVIFLCAVLKNALQYYAALSVSRLVRRFSNNLRKRVFSRYLSFGKLYFDRNNVGHLNGVLMGFTNAIAYRLSELQQAFTWLFLLVAYLAIMLAISLKLTLLVLCLFPVLNGALRWLIEKIKMSSRLYADAQTDLSRRVFNILTNIALVKSYAREGAEERQFSEISDLIERMEFSIDKKQNLVPPIQEVLILTFMILLVCMMAFIVVVGPLGRLSGMLVYIILMKRAATAFGSLNNLKVSLATVRGPVEDVLETFTDEDKHFVPDGTEELARFRAEIEFKSLSYSYSHGVGVLEDVSFRVPKGKMTALVGPSGAGKSTLINLLLRFYDCPPGSILIDGTDIRRFTLGSLRARVAMVSQEALLFNDSLRANIAYGLNGSVNEERLAEAVRDARLADFIARLPRGIDTLIGDRGVQLSGGEKQRVSIARAMLKGADILVLDEATSSLDSETEKAIQEAIDAIIQEKTAIVIAHRLSTIRKADQIVFLERGRVLETGGFDELMLRKGRFYRSWQEQWVL